jgi:hypothetical protein
MDKRSIMNRVGGGKLDGLHEPLGRIILIVD